MARPLRLEVPGGLYSVNSRGNNRQPIYLDDADRRRFLDTLESVTRSLNILCHDHCLMDNHYHLFLETPDANLQRAMRQLNGVYAQGFNRRHGRSGHLFQGRYHAKLVQDGLYSLVVSRYIVLNPVDVVAGVACPSEWPWSSYQAHAGLVEPPAFLTDDWILSHFHPTDRLAARMEYRRFIREGMRNPRPLGAGPILGNRDFIAKFHESLKRLAPLKEIPRKQRFAARPSLGELFENWNGRDDRNVRICIAINDHGYTMAELAHNLGLHPSTISRAVGSGLAFQRLRKRRSRRVRECNT